MVFERIGALNFIVNLVMRNLGTEWILTQETAMKIKDDYLKTLDWLDSFEVDALNENDKTELLSEAKKSICDWYDSGDWKYQIH